jgi:UDP-galactopyranose mutase
LPIRLTYDDNYFEDCYQGIPIGGYTAIFERLLKDIPVETGVDYLKDRNHLDSKARRVVYTGAIDEFFGCDEGKLEWRSLRFEHETLTGDFQGNAVFNYTDQSVPYTRICEHKHFEFSKQDHTVVTREYPQSWTSDREKYYPVNDDGNNELYQRYKQRVDESRYIMGGRLADYKYYDMHQVVGSALVRSDKEDTAS